MTVLPCKHVLREQMCWLTNNSLLRQRQRIPLVLMAHKTARVILGPGFLIYYRQNETSVTFVSGDDQPNNNYAASACNYSSCYPSKFNLIQRRLVGWIKAQSISAGGVYCLSCKRCNHLYIGRAGWSFCQAPSYHQSKGFLLSSVEILQQRWRLHSWHLLLVATGAVKWGSTRKKSSPALSVPFSPRKGKASL